MKAIKLPSDVQFILDKLNAEGYSAYVVGGCVRDSILHKHPKDWDICTSALPAEIKSCFNGFKTIDTGIKHGTVTVVMKDGQYEITTYRIESNYTDGRHPDSVVFTDSIIEDLSRRDFTVNAIAYSPKSGFIDPYHGIDDLSYKMIYCVNDPDERFKEDGLRILRALRFASTYGFNISSDVKNSIFININMLDNISYERINSELCKILMGRNALSILIEYAHVFGHIIPELESCIGFNQNNPYHIFDVYDHMMYALFYYQGKDLITKLALFLHDIGKPVCYSEDERGGHFYGHGSICADMAYNILRRLKFSNEIVDSVTELIRYHDSEIHPSQKSVNRWLNKLSELQLCRLLDIKEADIRAHSSINHDLRINQCQEVRTILNTVIDKDAQMNLSKLNINGSDIINLGMPQGPNIGVILNKCLDAVIEESIPNDRSRLLEYAKDLIVSINMEV